MKKIKKAAALLLSAALMLSLTACGSFEAKMAKAAARMAKLENYHLDMDMQLGMTISVLGQGLEMNMGMTGDIDVQTEPQRIKMDMSVSMLGLSQDVLCYMEKTGEEYTVYASADGGLLWTKETLDADEAPGQMSMADSVKLLAGCAGSFKEAGTETVLGSAAVRYDGEITGADLRLALEMTGADEMLSQSLDMEIDGDDISQLDSIPTSIWIDNKSGMIVRYDMDMTQTMQGLIAEILEERLSLPGADGVEMQIEISQAVVSVVLSQFNQVGEIEIPAEALSKAA